MDKSLPNKIAQSFEQQHDDAFLEAQLPDDLWDNIASELSAASPKEGYAIKQSFEAQHPDAALEATLPTALWDQIAEELDRPEGHTIKDSFEGEHTPELPASIWTAVEEELEIESVWKKISQFLDRRTRGRYWREKALQGSLLLLALLWIRGCDWSWVAPVEPTEPTTTTPTGPLATVPSTAPQEAVATWQEAQASAQMQGHHPQPAPELAAATPVPAAPATAGAARPTASLQGREPLPPAGGAVPRTATTPATPKPERPLATPTPRASTPPLTHASSPAPAANKASTQPNENSSTPWTPQFLPEVLKKEQSKSPVSLLATSPIPSTTLTASTSTAQEQTATPLLLARLATLPAPAALEQPLASLSMPEEPLAWRPKQSPQHRWEVGLQARLSSSLFWGSATAKALEATSMTTTTMQTTAGVGMVVALHWSHRDALLLTAHPLVTSRQSFGGYTPQGRYYRQQLHLTHAEGAFSYQRTLWQGSILPAQLSRVYARASYQLSHLTRGEEWVNDELLETTAYYQRWQHSAGLSLGVSQQIQRWVIDLGAYGNWGLSTMSADQAPWSDSRVVSWGGYVGLRYQL